MSFVKIDAAVSREFCRKPTLRGAIAAGMAVVGMALLMPAPARALVPTTEIQEPYTLSSTNGVLDLLMIATAAPIPQLSPEPTGFVYEVCQRPTNGSNTCPPLPAGYNAYAGPRLALKQGDVLKIHFINQLPLLTDSKHAVNPEEPGHEYLALNPTNIHTHGLLVSPHYPAGTDTTYGDNIFVLTFNSSNGTPSILASAHADVRMDATDYMITIPPNHPSGIYWIHPHVHGISLNQISAGLAGMITVGQTRDYVCNNNNCSNFANKLNVRHILLKDMEVLADGTRKDQPDTTMCVSPTTGGLVLPELQGYCAGQDFSGQGGPNYTGAKWFLTMNGQPYPTVTVNTQGGEVWRIVNATGSVTENLTLYNPAQGANMIFQVLSVDGISIDSSKGGAGSGMFTGIPCPGVLAPSEKRAVTCTDRVLMMPSSRVELWVSYRDANGNVIAPPPGATAIFRTEGYNTGPAGDTWPAVDLAQVNFNTVGLTAAPTALVVKAPPEDVVGQLLLPQDVNQTDSTPQGPNDGVVLANCTPLAPGHHRRVYFNVPSDYADLFGLGYEEIDQNGVPVPGTFQDVTEFNGAAPTVCLPLGPGNTKVAETWELVNLAGEDHNFHIHQTKFQVLSIPQRRQDGTTVPLVVAGNAALVDNVPVLHATGSTNPNSPKYDPNSPGGCSSVADWKNGLCHSTPTVISIPFYVAGDYVYHCHILEHEDGGMMARIRVLPNNPI